METPNALLADAGLNGLGAGERRPGGLVARIWEQLGKRGAYTLYAFAATAALVALGLRTGEPVGAYIAAVAVAFFGGGAWVKHSEAK